MTEDFIEIGLPSFSSKELENFAEKLSEKLFDYLSAEKLLSILTEYSIIINLEQDKSRKLTLNLEIESSGALNSEKLSELHEKISELLTVWLEEELRCYKNSEK
ncbi:MAG: hypothetical protein K9W45_07005 [Candidatus Heimdallarchaeum aukensis]|uniref:DUF3194 domain-containing protein n=1 Tax=Candidatus Heimdallarchaeum aukensis TaxID=2876573 RepID=A0A9Y1FIK9_9ARCH|nr:MAG: hypothetical protein K9W45_07005 [Candidatus Heimdallarchaeum aukensis]